MMVNSELERDQLLRVLTIQLGLFDAAQQEFRTIRGIRSRP